MCKGMDMGAGGIITSARYSRPLGDKVYTHDSAMSHLLRNNRVYCTMTRETAISIYANSMGIRREYLLHRKNVVNVINRSSVEKRVTD
jgi:hypothetical protein